jgi:hypothetical protein
LITIIVRATRIKGAVWNKTSTASIPSDGPVLRVSFLFPCFRRRDVRACKTFTDKVSGKDTARPKLQAALDYVREGDVLVVHSIDRLARNMSDLETLVRTLTGKGITVEFVSERLTFTGSDDKYATLLLHILGGRGSIRAGNHPRAAA